MIPKLAELGPQHVEDALRIADEMMRTYPLHPDKLVAQSLVKIVPPDHPRYAEFAGLKDYERVHVVHEQMYQLGSHGDTKGLIATFEQMKAAGVKRTEKTYLLLLGTLHDRNETKKLVDYFNEMKEVDNIAPSEGVYNLVLDSLARIGAEDRMVKIFEEMKQKKQNGQGDFKLTSGFNMLLKYYVKVDNKKKIQALLKEMEQLQVVPDEQTYTMIKMWSWTT